MGWSFTCTLNKKGNPGEGSPLAPSCASIGKEGVPPAEAGVQRPCLKESTAFEKSDEALNTFCAVSQDGAQNTLG